MTRAPARLLLPIALALAGPPAHAVEPGAEARAEAPEADVRGQLRRRGVRAAAVGVEIRAERPDGAPLGSAFTDAEGAFTLRLPTGPAVLIIDDPAFVAETRAVDVPPAGLALPPWPLTPAPGGAERLRVYGRRPPGATGLDAEALRTTAGTFGDPLRALQSLPSVGTVLSLVPFPIVRGSAPGDTAIRVDGTPIPLLFHSGVGQGVIPSVLVDRITLHTGGAPLDIGGVVTAIEVETAEPDAPGLRGEALLDLVQAGALVSTPLAGGRLTAGGRIGYPGWVLSLIDQPVIIDFADYHLRYGWRSGRRRLRISLFGATDRFGDDEVDAGGEPDLTEMAFHRLALRWFEPLGAATLEAALDLGADRFDLPQADDDDLYFFRSASGARLDEWLVRARVAADIPLVHGRDLSLDLDVGLEQTWTRTENDAETVPGDRLIVAGTRDRLRTAAWIGATLRLGPARIQPGVRLDLYDDPLRYALDPRLDARIDIGRDSALVGRIGRTRGPQRYPYPIPGVGEYALEPDLHDTTHGQLGLEQRLPAGFDLRWSIFGRRTDGLKASPLDPVRPDIIGAAYADYAYGDARAVGSELLLRRRAQGWIHGWLSYTVQRVDRRLDDPRLAARGPWRSSLLEQNHLLNGVLTVRLPGGWSLGARLHYTSGRPRGLYTAGRLDGYAQLDARVEYRWIADVYTGSAWLDVINITHAGEPTRPSATEPAEPVAFTLPMLGVRARF